ncbi:MAG: 4Fe-4S dicluster domain-containing protein [Planctomycetota bacterium]
MAAAVSRSKAGALERIAAHGVVGAGGAGFPTHVKLAAQAETIILNAAECEPLLHKDKELLRHFTDDVLAGLHTAAELVGARDVAIGIKGKYTDVIELLLSRPGVFHETTGAGPSATGKTSDGGVRIIPLHDSYPSGDEFILVYDVTHKIVPPGGLPLHVGCVVLNVETALNIARDAPVTHKFLTIAGAVRQPCTVRVPVGLPVRDALTLAGGATVANPRILSGGAMMGQLAGLDDPLTKTCGGLLVLPPDHFLIRRYELPWKLIAQIGASACDQCSFCTELCPRYLLGHPIEPHKAMRALGFVDDRQPHVRGTQFCCECNLCTMIACPEDLDPKNVCTHNKRDILAAQRRAGEGEAPAEPLSPRLRGGLGLRSDGEALAEPRAEPPARTAAPPWRPAAHPYRAELHLDNRRVPISRLINKLGLRQFANEGPLRGANAQPPETRADSRAAPAMPAPARVELLLKQHVGAPAAPAVRSGARVKSGDLVARPPDGALGACIHASIDGVCEVLEDRIAITADPNPGRQAGATP